MPSRSHVDSFDPGGMSAEVCRTCGPFKEMDQTLHYGLEEILVAFGDDPYPASLEDRMALMEQGVMKKIGEYMESQ